MRLGSWSLNWRGLVLLYGFVITLLFCFFSLYRPPLLTVVGLKIYDAMLYALPPSEGKNGPVLVNLDEKSLTEFGQWPWPRYRMAQLLDKLHQLAPRAVGLDILFAEPDRTSLRILQQELHHNFALRLDISGVPEHMANNDLALARSLARGPFVLGYKFLFEGEGSPGSERLLHPVVVAARQRGSVPADAALFTARAVITNISELSLAASASGFLNYPADADGVLRRVPLLLKFQDQIYPSMALATAMLAMGRKNIVLDLEDGRLQAVLLDKHRIPVDEAGNLLLAYQGKHVFFDAISAADVLHDKVDKDRIAGKIILLGTTATGLMDTHTSPLDPHFPGVAVHATVVENIINNHFLARPAWADGAELAFVFLLGLLSTFILAMARPLFSIFLLVYGSAGLWYGSFFLLREQSVFVNPLVPGLVLFVNFALLNLLKYWREEQEVRKRTRELLLAQHTTILSMTALVETRDNETGGHILRTQHYVRALAEYLASRQKYKKFLDPSTIDMLFRSAPLHDIGKVGVADRILLHPGKLSPEDFDTMKKHTVYGYETLLKAQHLLQDEQGHSFLRIAAEIAHSHHEKWNGSGYPRGLRGEDIPLAGRLMALADVYDALVSARRYKRPCTHKEARQVIEKGSGSHFDPEVVEAFVAVEAKFLEIAQRFSDDTAPGQLHREPLPLSAQTS